MCDVLLPPGVNPTAVKYIYHIIIPNTKNGRLQQDQLRTACSLYINTLYFYLWRLLKILVYSSPIQNADKLHQRISDASKTICNRLETFEKSATAFDLMFPCMH
jgi:hypothetical protein